MGINRLGDAGCARRRPCRSGSAHGSDHRRRFPPADRERYRCHGTIRSKRHCLRAPQQRYLIERALEENPDWTYNDLAPWKYAELPKALGCADWFTARVSTLGELDEAMM